MGFDVVYHKYSIDLEDGNTKLLSIEIDCNNMFEK